MKLESFNTLPNFDIWSKRILYCFIVLNCLTGIISYSEYNYLPTRLILELAFFVSSLFLVFKASKSSILISISFLLYITLSYLIYIYSGGEGIYDYLVIFKSFIYFVFLPLFFKKKIFTVEDVDKIFCILLISFFLKYALWLMLGVSSRPGLFGENNFELIFLLLMFLASWTLTKKISVVNGVLLLSIFAMSGSRSGIVALLSVIFALNIRRIDAKFIIGLIVIVFLLVATYFTFMSRMTDRGVEGIDRYVFFTMFLRDIDSWSWYNYLLGTKSITPMSYSTCRALSFYQNLFSYYTPGVCYSVILHSFVLRTIYDHGFLGLAILIIFIEYGLKISNYNFRERLAVIGLLLLTGLSVSSLNSIFVAIGLAVLFSVDRESLKS